MKKIFLALFLCLFFALPTQAEEKIDEYKVVAKINADASVDIQESITYNFGNIQKHGIFRFIPISYDLNLGKYKIKIKVKKVTDETGVPYNYTTSVTKGLIEIKIGEADKLVTGTKKYIINYTVERAMLYLEDHDEFYWNAIGTDWGVRIENVEATVIFPRVLNIRKEMTASCYKGEFGSKNECESMIIPGNNPEEGDRIIYSDKNFGAHNGMALITGFPKGTVYQPTKKENLINLFLDNWMVAVPLVTFLVMFLLWFTKGRDPSGRSTIVTQFDPPDKLTPIEIGVIVDHSAHNRDTTAEIINLAVNGYIKITRVEKTGWFGSDDYIFTQLKATSDLVNAFDKKIAVAFFTKGNTIKLSDLKNKFYKDYEIIQELAYTAVKEKGYIPKSPKKVKAFYTILGGSIMLGSFYLFKSIGALNAVSSAISGLIIIIFGRAMSVRTKKGVLAKEHILGLKNYLTVAEKDRLEFHNAPEKNPEQFEKLLPFAIALGVENAWAKQFENVYNVSPGWYYDPIHPSFSSISLVNSLDNFKSASNAVLPSSPNNKGSGGGFSGGGFGGGGGGSW